jgi:hypothetical protein
MSLLLVFEKGDRLVHEVGEDLADEGRFRVHAPGP